MDIQTHVCDEEVGGVEGELRHGVRPKRQLRHDAVALLATGEEPCGGIVAELSCGLHRGQSACVLHRWAETSNE